MKGHNRDSAWFAAIDTEWPALRAAFERWLDPANFDAAGRQSERLSDLTAPSWWRAADAGSRPPVPRRRTARRSVARVSPGGR